MIPGLAANNINIGPADVYYAPLDINGDPTAEIYLGLTKDGAKITYKPTWHQIKSDQYGENVMDAVLVGEDVICEVALLETNKIRIAVVVLTASTVGGKDNPSAVTFGRTIGLRASQVCGQLRIHPISFGKTDQSSDVIIYLAYNEKGLELAYVKDNEWIIPTLFRGLVDDRREDGDKLFRIGTDDGSVVDKGVKAWTLSPLNDSMTVGDTKEFALNVVFEDNTNGDVTKDTVWTSSDTSVATIALVGGKAIATGIAAGTTIISASYGGDARITSLYVTAAGA